MAKKQQIQGPIPSIETPWDNGTQAYSGADVEEFIKSQFRSKFGDMFFDDSVDASLTVYFFKDTEDKQEWLQDRSNTALVLRQQTFDVASRHGEGTAFIVTLKAQGAAEPKFTNEKKMLIPLQFTCRKATTIAGTTTTEDMAGTSGTITVSGRRAGASGAFQTITPMDGQPRYMDAVALDSTQYKDFDLGPYLQDGEWNYRINIIEPEKLTSSTSVNVNVTMSESMGLDYAGDLGHVFEGDVVALPFYVKGSVARHLHLQVLSADGHTVLAEPEAIAFAANEGGNETVQNIRITKSQYAFKHGTYLIRAWLTFASDVNGTKVSDQTFGIMFKEDGNTQVLVAVADAITEADNFDTVTLLRYSVYNPADEPYALDLTIVDGMNGEKVYYSETVVCENNNTYTMRTALNCEHELGDFNILVKLSHGKTVHYTGSILLTNDMDFSPRGTADLVLAPSTKTFYGTDTRGNSFTFDPDTLQLVNQPKDNKTKILNPTVEGFVRENGVDRFRLLKGSLLDLPFEPITATTGLKKQGVDYSMTMEFDIEISGIVDEYTPVISCFTEENGSILGLKVLPNRVLVLGNGQDSISDPDKADYYLEENRRIHVAINMVNNLRNEGLNYMRIFADGIIQREYTYVNDNTSPFCNARGTNGHLMIGSTGCNIDIYGIRIMLDEAMSSAYIQQDYKASMPSIEQKRAFVAANDAIMNGDVIDYNKAKEVYNTILYELPSNAEFLTFNNDKDGDKVNNVRMTVNIIGDEKHSGVFSSVEMKRQGSTAKKYFWPNIGTKLCKANADKGIVAGKFTSFGINPETNEPYYNKTSYYQLNDEQPKSKKWVGKSNYASSMQSHKIGATHAFQDLHRKCALPDGGFTYDKENPKTPSRRAVLEYPFLCFYTDKNHATPTYCGFQTWGAAKGDKPTFGLTDDPESPAYTPDYVMVEGADNNVTGANFETPWIPSEMVYDAKEESFCYNGAANFDFDLGQMDEDETHPVDGAMTSLNSYIIPAFNMVYLLNPNLRPYNGGLNALNQAHQRDNIRKSDEENTEPLELEANVHYWNCDTSSPDYLNVYRLDYVRDVWVNAGLTTGSTKDAHGFNNISVSVLNLKQQLNITDSALFGMNNEEKNETLIQLRVKKFKTEFPKWFDVSDALFHQCIVKMWAGTDNRAKNTYYWIEGNIDHKIRFAGDDLDTIFKTDNKGQQSKKYWILEEDKDEMGAWFWNGRNNGLFRLIEMAYEDDMRTMMSKILNAMVSISGSVTQFYQDYFFYVQEYFPAVAYNEAARLLYEQAQLYYDGIHPSEPGKAYGYKEVPITQSLGNQIHAEREYLTKRLALMESYANFGDFSLNGTDSITFTSTGNSTYNIKWTAYQDIFPVAAFGQALDYGTDKDGVRHTAPWRLKAGETVSFITPMSGETTIAIHGMSFCSDIGNLGANAIKGTLRLTGKRLRKLVMPKTSPMFMPSSIMLTNNLKLELIDWRNIDFSYSKPSFDLSTHMNLEKLDLSGCSGIIGVNVPKTAALKSLRLPSGLNRLELNGIPSLSEFSIDSVTDLKDVLVDHKGVDSMALLSDIFANTKELLTISMLNVKWSGLTTAMLMWLANQKPYSYGLSNEKYTLTGNVTVDQSRGRITCDNKRQLISVYGNIDATKDVPLALTYDKFQIKSVDIVGPSYIKNTGITEYGIAVTPAISNNIAIVTEEDGTVHEDVKFTFVDSEGREMLPAQFCTWQDAVKGLLNVIKVTNEASGAKYNLRVTVRTIVGNDYKTLTSEMLVGFYLRHPKLGDFAYADGSFDDQPLKGKTCVGMVYKLDPMYQGPDDGYPIIFTGFKEPSEQIRQEKSLVGYKVLIDCKEVATIRSKSGFVNGAGNAWGIYPQGTTGIYSSNGFTTDTQQEIAAAAGLVSTCDTPIANVTSTGLQGGSNNSYLTTTNVLNTETESGFKSYNKASNAAIDRWNGKEDTDIIVQHMEAIFNNYLMSSDNNRVNTIYEEAGVRHELLALPQNLEELGDMMEILQKANGNLAIFRQFAYPAGYSCYLYEPTVNDGEVLDPQYARNQWFLPAAGDLARMFVYFALSRTGGWGAERTEGASTVPAVSVIDNMIRNAYSQAGSNYIKDNVSYAHIESGQYTINEIAAINKYFHSMVESERPLYSLLMWRVAKSGINIPFTQHSTGYHWSSTEYGSGSSWGVYFGDGNVHYYYGSYKNHGHTVRPAVAYSFYL